MSFASTPAAAAAFVRGRCARVLRLLAVLLGGGLATTADTKAAPAPSPPHASTRHERHYDLGEIPGPFAGWEMPAAAGFDEAAFENALAHSRGAELSAARMRAALDGDARVFDAEKRQGQDRIDFLEEAARRGDGGALLVLADLLAQGDDLARDQARAIAYYKAAALAGRMEAAHNLGRIYAAGAGVRRDYAESLAWLIVARERGDPSDAEEQLRQHLLDRQQPATIAAAEKRALELGPKASPDVVLAALPPPAPLRYRPPTPPATVAPDTAETVDVHDLAPGAAARRAADEPPPEVVVMTITGVRLTWRTLAELQQAADRNEPSALDALGRLLAAGRLVPQDSLRAVVLLERAATAGDIDAAHKLGDLYSDADGVQRDEAKAFSFYLQAARGGSVLAMANVGIDYTNGRGVAADYVQGLAWLIVAKHFGVDAGQEQKLRTFLSRNQPVKIPAAESAAGNLIREIEAHRT